LRPSQLMFSFEPVVKIVAKQCAARSKYFVCPAFHFLVNLIDPIAPSFSVSPSVSLGGALREWTLRIVSFDVTDGPMSMRVRTI
jgi:hypothetical protein